MVSNASFVILLSSFVRFVDVFRGVSTKYTRNKKTKINEALIFVRASEDSLNRSITSRLRRPTGRTSKARRCRSGEDRRKVVRDDE